MEVKQIQPNHADHISGYKQEYILDMLQNERVIAQPKYDGERMLIHFDHGKVYCTSRRFSKKTGKYMENQDKLSELCEIGKTFDKDYTVLDCECYAKDWSTIAGILHSLPERAKELCKLNTPCFAVFDCLFYDGKDIRDEKYVTRLVKACRVVNTINYLPLHLVSFMNDIGVVDINSASEIHTRKQIDSYMQKSIDMGFEGIVVKSFDRKYYDKGASIKCKKFETVDCVVYDYQQGRGKYENTVGALLIGYYDEETKSIIHISNVNCGTDEERNMWRDNWQELKNSVIEVKCQEITSKSLRHPVYIRLRKDKDYKMCTKETIFGKNQ